MEPTVQKIPVRRGRPPLPAHARHSNILSVSGYVRQQLDSMKTEERHTIDLVLRKLIDDARKANKRDREEKTNGV